MNWSQLQTIVWLRWRLARNQWSRGGSVNFIITMIFAVMGLAIGAGCGIGGLLAGALAFSQSSPMVFLLVWDLIAGVFLFWGLISIVVEIQRSETIDISRMLHLPVSLREIFLLNYIASHLTANIVIFLPGMLGLSAGLIIGRGWRMICLFPLAISFVFMITAWSYCLRGWLATLMINKRRRRAIIAAVTFTFILLSQLPNLFGNVLFNHKQRRPNNTTQSTQSDQQTTSRPHRSKDLTLPHGVLAAHNYIPILWVGNGAMSLAQGNVWPAILGSGGMLLIGGWGLRRAYRTTLRFYQGQTLGKSKARKPKAEKTAVVAQNTFLDKQLPGIPQEAAAMALASFRCFTRAPEVKMAIATNFFMMIFLGMMFLLRHSVVPADSVKPFIATGTIAMMFFGISQLMFNQFGFDRGGFRQLILLPTPRKYILLGKNLAILPATLGIGLIFLILITVTLHIPLVIIIAAGFQLVTAFLLLSMAGNFLSIFVPYRIAAGSLKITKVPAMTIFLISISHSLFPTAMSLIFLPPALGLLLSKAGWMPAALTNVVLSILLLVVFAFLYWHSLTGLGSLLQQREKKILEVVSREVE